MDKITSVSNDKIKATLRLRESSVRKERQQYLIEGFHLVCEALKQGVVVTIFATHEGLAKIKHKLNPKIEVFLVSEQVAQKLSATVTSQGIFAICKMPKVKVDYAKNILLLDRIQDPGNVGTLIRSAASFGFATVIACPKTVSFYNDKVLRATQGNIFAINLVRDYLIKVINDLKSSNYLIVGTNLHDDNAKPLQKAKFYDNQKYALIIGNESKGISPELLDLIDLNVNIEMNNSVESLNAGVAGSVIMYKINVKRG